MKGRSTGKTAKALQFSVLVFLTLLPIIAQAQYPGGRRGRFMDDLTGNPDYQWPVDPAFADDVFTFARLEHDSEGGYGGYGRRWHGGWDEDSPRADVILSFRLHQITSLNVNPGYHPIEFTKEELEKHPFIYFSGVEQLSLHEDEVKVLRNYLQSGGFMMVDNFWGDAAWLNFLSQVKRVLPQSNPVDLPIDHPIFHIVYDFKKKPQMPSAGVYEHFGIFYDPMRDYDIMGHDPHYYGVFDEKGRIMMVICHNNHYGDGWEHEGDDPDYFHVISEGMAYPMFINILVYAMTH